jgi:PAS domain S-box-containing protein
VYVNPAWERVTGYSRAEAIGRTPSLVNSGRQSPEFYRDMWAALARGELWSGALVNRRKDGSLYDEVAAIFPVRDTSGQLANYVGLLRDVTHERQIEEQFRQSQKMEAVGRLAGGVAHDFNNLLTVISGRCQLLLHRLGRDNAVSHDIDLILKTANRAASLTRQLLAFSRKQVLSMQVLDLNAVVTNLQKMLRPLIGEDIELVTSLDPALGRVKADPGQIEQVVVNLAVNARDAMPRAGRITIETANADATDPALPVGAGPGPWVRLTMSDTGDGMDAETMSHIFEPFFTTKGVEKGTGLGLSTVYGIVKQSGGEVVVESQVGQGARFRVYLPRVDETMEPVDRPAAPASRGGKETILLVEDEPDVRVLTRELLESEGYTVLEASSAGEALRMAAAHTARIHLVLTDVVMPQMDGRQLVERLRTMRSEIASLYMSGYTEDAVLRYGVMSAQTAFLGKPFTADALTRKVRAVLDAARRADEAPAGVGAASGPDPEPAAEQGHS